jgi:hypothetical protein
LNRAIRQVLQYTLSLIIGIGLIWWAFRGIDFSQILEKFKTVDMKWVYLSVGIGAISHFLRAYRWGLLLKPLGNEIPLKHSYPIILSMYMVNLFLPRAGEIYRCGALRKTDGVPFSISIGTVIAERFFDVLFLAVFLFSMVFIELDKFRFLFNELITKKLEGNTGLLLPGFIILLVLALILFLIFKVNSRNSTFMQKIRTLAREVFQGLTSYRKMKQKGKFWISSILIWVAYFFMTYVMIFSNPETANLSLSVGFMLLALGGLAMAAPVQGGIGTFHVLVSQGLALYGLSKSVGLFFATLLHSLQFISLILLGGISFIYLILFVFNKKTHGPEIENS